MTRNMTIQSDKDMASGLTALLAIDPRLKPIAEIAGPLPLRRQPPGFGGLARIIIAQQVSKQSADAIAARFATHVPDATPAAFVATDDETLRAIGLSRPKQRTLATVAQAIIQGDLDLDRCANIPADQAIAHLSAIKGIGPWTAEVYLLFCVGHRDIFPAGDLALQIAVEQSLALTSRPTDKQLRAIAESWAPWRGLAARLFWAWYGQTRNRAVMP